MTERRDSIATSRQEYLNLFSVLEGEREIDKKREGGGGRGGGAGGAREGEREREREGGREED